MIRVRVRFIKVTVRGSVRIRVRVRVNWSVPSSIFNVTEMVSPPGFRVRVKV